jgi:hypothetical protein
LGEVEKALDPLGNSRYSRSWIEHDTDLANLRDLPRFSVSRTRCPWLIEALIDHLLALYRSRLPCYS